MYPVFGNLAVIYLLIRVFNNPVENLARVRKKYYYFCIYIYVIKGKVYFIKYSIVQTFSI